jgi:redox-sensitive bicupin YhaK (pirin superfamily)
MDNKEFKNKLKISDSWLGQEVNEGDAVVVRRIIGINKMTDIDPYLMLDFFENSKLPGGFPDHPHRGFETVTYLIQGKIFHEDFNGHRGEIEEGDIQWMTAGKGIVHAEMPYSFTLPTSGFQLWINLKKEFKLKEPHYQEIKRDKIPVFNDPNGNFTITIISGKYGDLEGPCKSTTPTSFMDIKMKSNSEFEVPIGEGENSGLVFLFEGKDLKVGDKISIKQYYAVRFDSKSQNNIKFKTENSNFY